jgi:hypothetical protein
MEIFSALKSWGSRGSKNDLNCDKLLPMPPSGSKLSGFLSPRFSRIGSKRIRRGRGRNLTPHRENKIASNSLPTSRASSVFGDSCLDLFSGVSNYRPEDYLDANQGTDKNFFFIFPSLND